VARRALSPAQLAVVAAVRAVLPDDPVRVRVACSGGADSLALAAGLVWCDRHDPDPLRSVSAMVVDHGLQPGSDAVAARAVTVLHSLGLDATAVRVHVDAASPDGLEAAARDARYAALAGPGADLVLLGHTLDDQAETVLLGLARGSGTRSLAGMPATFTWADPEWDKQAPSGRDRATNGPIGPDGVAFVPLFARPLLGLRRATTAQACADWDIATWDDPMNADPRFARVRARRLLPDLERALGPGVAEALARTAALTRDDADLLDVLAAKAQASAPPGDGLSAPWLADLAPALRGRVVRTWLVAQGLDAPDFDHTQAVLDLVTAWHGQRGVDVPGGTVVRERDILHAIARK